MVNGAGLGRNLKKMSNDNSKCTLNSYPKKRCLRKEVQKSWTASQISRSGSCAVLLQRTFGVYYHMPWPFFNKYVMPFKHFIFLITNVVAVDSVLQLMIWWVPKRPKYVKKQIINMWLCVFVCVCVSFGEMFYLPTCFVCGGVGLTSFHNISKSY